MAEPSSKAPVSPSEPKTRQQFLHVADVFENQPIARQIEKSRRSGKRPSPRQHTVDDLDRAGCELFDFCLPLIFDPSRGDYQHSLDSPTLV